MYVYVYTHTSRALTSSGFPKGLRPFGGVRGQYVFAKQPQRGSGGNVFLQNKPPLTAAAKKRTSRAPQSAPPDSLNLQVEVTQGKVSHNRQKVKIGASLQLKLQQYRNV